MKKIIYLDNASTTQVRKEVVEVMNKVMLEDYGNPSSSHRLGEEAMKKINEVRGKIANEIGAKANEIIFTSGATEANNLVLNGVCGMENSRKNIFISAIEHSSVYECAMNLKSRGYNIVEIPVNVDGIIDIDFMEKNIDENTLLVSVIHGNNEIGVLQDLNSIGKICKKNGTLFHSDCVQSFGKEKIRVRYWNLDFISASGHKIGASKGIGFLYVKEGLKLKPLFVGGGQEAGRRAGTENSPGIVGFGKALEIVKKEKWEDVRKIRDYFVKELIKLGGRIN